MTRWSLRRLHAVGDADVEQLVDVLLDCVDGGASVSFMAPLTRERAVRFWRRVAEDVDSGRRALIVAEDAHGVCGTVQLILDLPENQPHRAEVAKMLVHRRARRQGIGEALMRAAEAIALECGRTLLVLDTVSGTTADRLYTRLGWTRVGEIPDYALMPDGAPCPTTVFYRKLAETPAWPPRRGARRADARQDGAASSGAEPQPARHACRSEAEPR